MTIRDKIEAARHKVGMAMSIGCFACALSPVLAVLIHKVFGLIFAAGLILAIGAWVYGGRIRCPQCRGRIGRAMKEYPIGLFSRTWKTVRFCPYCGVDLDSELPPEQGTSGPPT